ncbi:hypothetical protein NBRC116493_36030 [Aurantivibrio infirmus]
MSDIEIERKIREVDWSQYNGPECFSASELQEALLDLLSYDESRAVHGLDNKVLFAVGNNHAGTYYPAILEATDILINIETSGENESSRKCAFAILNDLTCFEPELGSYKGCSNTQLQEFVATKLKNYEDQT